MSNSSRTLLVLVVLAAIFAFTGITPAIAVAATITFGVLLAVFVVSWVLGLARGTARPRQTAGPRGS